MKEQEARELAEEINAQYAGRISAEIGQHSQGGRNGGGYRVLVECKVANRSELVQSREQWKGILDAWSLWIHPPSEPERYDRKARAQVLLRSLAEYKAYLGPFHECGCPIWVAVKGGERCLRCWPPHNMPAELRRRLNTIVK